MSVQRIGQKFACCSVELNGADKLTLKPFLSHFIGCGIAYTGITIRAVFIVVCRYSMILEQQILL